MVFTWNHMLYMYLVSVNFNPLVVSFEGKQLSRHVIAMLAIHSSGPYKQLGLSRFCSNLQCKKNSNLYHFSKKLK